MIYRNCTVCEVRKTIGFSVEDLIHVLKATHSAHRQGKCVPSAGARKAEPKSIFARRRKEQIKAQEIQGLSPRISPHRHEVLARSETNHALTFLWPSGSNTRLATIGVYPGSAVKQAVKFLNHCIRFFEFPISYVLTGNGTCFTDRFQIGSQTPSGKHLFDKTCKAHNIEHRLTPAYHPKPTGWWSASIAGSTKSLNLSISTIGRPWRIPFMGISTTTIASRCSRLLEALRPQATGTKGRIKEKSGTEKALTKRNLSVRQEPA